MTSISHRLGMAACACVALAATASAAGEEARTGIASLTPNTWVEISQSAKPPMAYCSTWYAPTTDEFIMWGKIGGHRSVSRQYEVQTLSLADAEPAWRESFPQEKEATWSNGRFPNWGCHCHRLRAEQRATLKGPWLETVFDRWVGSGRTNVVSFATTDGVLRPTRCPTYHQGTYDTRRNRVLYYAGGRTFAYDPKERLWTDLKAKPPLACDGLLWASLCYDPVGDQAVLFGGGFALTPWGGARTWIFDCKTNEWHRPTIKDGTEPPLRCSAQLVYDSKNKVMVLFGGDAQTTFLADTWVFDPASLEWTERKPRTSPPPLDRYAACFIEKHGVVFLVTAPRRIRGRRYSLGAAWTYDAAANEWTPLKGRLPSKHMEWISCDYSPRHDAVLLAAPGVGTGVYRLDPATATDDDPKRRGVPPGTWVFNSRSAGQMKSILGAPPPDRTATEKALTDLPVNTVIDSRYPGILVSKTWSTAVIDSDRGVVLYTGGGHSGYKGNDIALYDLGTNRWSFQAPPSFMPFLYNYNGALFGWGYGFRPTSQHTYRWYCYDPASRTMVYCPRHLGIRNGMTVLLDDDPAKAFMYDRKTHGDFTWIYGPAGNRLYRPVPGRPFGNSWSLALVGTPKGVFAKAGRALYLGAVTVEGRKADIRWTLVDSSGPAVPKGYGGEFQPLIYDSKRKRLLYLVGGKDVAVRVYEHPLEAGAWRLLETTGPTRNSREVVYDTANDCLISMPARGLMVMDCTTNEWHRLDVTMPKGSYGTECALVYDPVHEVCVMLIPHSFSGKLGVYLFRYDPKTATAR